VSAPELIFEDPPANPRGTHPGTPNKALKIWLATLASHPNRWARTPFIVNGGVSHQINGGCYGWSRGDFEACTRSTPGGSVVYARYVGGES